MVRQWRLKCETNLTSPQRSEGQLTITKTTLCLAVKHLLTFSLDSIDAMYCRFLLLVLLAASNALAFSLSLHTQSSSCNTVLHAAADRRAFVQGVAAAAFFSAVTPAFAEDVDELAMPSEDEEAKAKAVRRGISFL